MHTALRNNTPPRAPCRTLLGLSTSCQHLKLFPGPALLGDDTPFRRSARPYLTAEAHDRERGGKNGGPRCSLRARGVAAFVTGRCYPSVTRTMVTIAGGNVKVASRDFTYLRRLFFSSPARTVHGPVRGPVFTPSPRLRGRARWNSPSAFPVDPCLPSRPLIQAACRRSVWFFASCFAST